MISLLKNAFVNVRIADLFDITVISVILYFVLIWLRRRASRSAIIAIIAVLSLYSCARIFSMYITSMLFQAGLTAALMALVLIFQEDIRMTVEQISAWSFFRSKHALVASSRTVDFLVESFYNLSRDSIGALAVVKGRDSLDRHLSGGISLNGRLSTPLLYSIFHPATPSHDGAVIIEGDRIERFGVRLPLSHNLAEVGDAGTRHTAALGLAERSDALMIVASEEHGTLSIAEQGRLERVTPELLRVRLDAFYRRVFPQPARAQRRTWLTKNIPLKLFSLGLAALLWLMLAFHMETVNRTFTVPVEYRNVPPNWTIDNPRPSEIQLTLSGVERAFSFDPTALVVSLDLANVKEGSQELSPSRKDIDIPSGLKISQMLPRSVTVSAQEFQMIEIPVKVRTTGTPRNRTAVPEIRLQPDQIKVLVPKHKHTRITEIGTDPLDLTHVEDNFSTRLQLLLPPDVRLVNENESSVRVVVKIRDKVTK